MRGGTVSMLECGLYARVCVCGCVSLAERNQE